MRFFASLKQNKKDHTVVILIPIYSVPTAK